MLRRTIVVFAAAVFAFPTMLSGATAGGMSSFDFDRRYYVVGDRAVGQTEFWISRKDRHLLDRTFYAYLIPDSRWIDPPRIPSEAVSLGPIALGGMARISFTVPEVAPGGYTVGICDRPCRNSYVGDLGGGWINVTGSPEEARLLPVIDRLELRLDQARWDASRKARKSQRRVAELRAGLEALEADLDQARKDLATRLVAVEARPPAAPGAFDRAGWAVAALTAAALAFVAARRRTPPLLGRPASPEEPPVGNEVLSDDASTVLEPGDLGWKIEAAEIEDRRTPVRTGRN
ncbi:MAG: hypothetical protein ACRDIX_06385 [Actinomycetota bacterium]